MFRKYRDIAWDVCKSLSAFFRCIRRRLVFLTLRGFCGRDARSGSAAVVAGEGSGRRGCGAVLVKRKDAARAVGCRMPHLLACCM